MAVSAWSDLSSTTISNCFRHCGFLKAKCLDEAFDHEYDEFNVIRGQFNNIVPKKENICFDSYVNCDEHLSVSEPLDIISNTELSEINELNEDIDNDDDSADLTDAFIKTDLKTVTAYLDYIRLYALQRKEKTLSNDLVTMINNLEKLVHSEPKEYKQTL